jgi:hypothetical protein
VSRLNKKGETCMKDVKTLAIGLVLGLLVAMALGQTKAPAPAAAANGPRYQITAVQTGTRADEAVIYVLDNRTHAVSSCRQVDGKWQSASAFQLPE